MPLHPSAPREDEWPFWSPGFSGLLPGFRPDLGVTPGKGATRAFIPLLRLLRLVIDFVSLSSLLKLASISGLKKSLLSIV